MNQAGELMENEKKKKLLLCFCIGSLSLPLAPVAQVLPCVALQMALAVPCGQQQGTGKLSCVAVGEDALTGTPT